MKNRVNIITHYGLCTTRLIVGCDTVANDLASWLSTVVMGAVTMTSVTKAEADRIDNYRDRGECMRAAAMVNDYFKDTN